MATAALVLLSSTAAFSLDAPKATPDAASPQASAKRAETLLHTGDKIKLVFYERLDSDDDKWRGGGRAVPRGFHQRSELCGEYAVQEDGTVSLPMLGRFDAAGLTQDAFIANLTKPFEALIDRKGFVNVVALEHRPIYVVGPVKNPGSYKFEGGMTVLHAVALSGGLKQRETETWQRVEFGREVERLQRGLDKAKRLLARTTVLRAERDGGPVSPGELKELAGKTQATALVGEESWQRSMTTMSRSAQEASLLATLANAKSEFAARNERVAPLDASIALRSERVKGMTGLVDRNVVGRTVLIQAQSELTDAQDRRQQAVLEVEVARKRVTEAEREMEKFRVDNKVEVNRATAAAQREGAETMEESQGLLDVIRALAANQGPSDADGGISYEVVRQTPTGTVALALPETAPLVPGDLVRLKQVDSPPAAAAAPVAAISPAEAAPAAPRTAPARPGQPRQGTDTTGSTTPNNPAKPIASNIGRN